MANADEALFSKSFVDRLPAQEASRLRPLDRLHLKGVSSPIEVYSFIDDDPDVQTQIPLGLAETRVPLGAWRAAAFGYALPKRLRDPLYRWVARNRYRWFGRRAQCFVPSATDHELFLV